MYCGVGFGGESEYVVKGETDVKTNKGPLHLHDLRADIALFPEREEV